MPMIPLKCPMCKASLTVDSDTNAAICESCGKPYVVKDAIVQNYIMLFTTDTADDYAPEDFVINNGVLEKYNGEDENIVIPHNVKKIGEGAFQKIKFASITIPNSVTSVARYAFSSCLGSSKVNINDISAWCKISFDGLHSNPLEYAHNLYINDELVTELTLPDSVKSIGRKAFFGCTSLKKVNITDLSAWCGIAFGDYCSNPLSCTQSICINGETVTELVIPNSVNSIGNYAFYNCTGLTSVTLPESVTNIGQETFGNCTSLKSVTIKNGDMTIEPGAFFGCLNVEEVSFPQNSSIDIMAFEGTPWFENYTKENNLCRHCGTKFKGLLKICPKCHCPKDYR